MSAIEQIQFGKELIVAGQGRGCLEAIQQFSNGPHYRSMQRVKAANTWVM